MTTVQRTLPPCALRPEVYQDEQLLSPRPRHMMTADEWRDFQRKRAAAHHRCAGCAVLVECLYRAVVEVDVSGFLACTSEDERRRIRQALGLRGPLHVPSEEGLRSGSGPVDHRLVMDTRRAHPNETTQQLADRLDCSISTVKRHLRREREGTVDPAGEPDPPTLAEVLDAFDDLEKTVLSA